MGGVLLTQRQVIGRYFWRYMEEAVNDWAPEIANLFQSDHVLSERVGWMGSPPSFKEWAGDRAGKNLQENFVDVLLRLYEATEEWMREEFTMDKSDQVMTRIDELAVRGVNHWGSLLTDLIVAGETKTGYDGQFFFDTDHSEGSSGAQSNILTVTGLANPQLATPVEVEGIVRDGMARIMGFLDDEGEPFAIRGRRWLLMVPTGLWKSATAALSAPVIVSGSNAVTNVLAALGDRQVTLVQNPRLDTKGTGGTAWFGTAASRMALFSSDQMVKPFIRLQNLPTTGPGVNVTALGPDSEHCVKTNKCLFGADARRGAGYGYWQLAALLKFTT